MNKCGIKTIFNGEQFLNNLINEKGFKYNSNYLSLPRKQRLILVKNALQIINDTDGDQQIKSSLEEELKKLQQPIINSYYSNVNRNYCASVNISNPSILINFLSPNLNQILYNNIRSFFTKLTIGDYDNPNKFARNLCFDDVSLNNNIRTIKIQLLNALCSYTGDNFRFRQTLSDQNFYNQYKIVMQHVATKLIEYQKLYFDKNRSSDKIDNFLSSEFKSQFFDALQNYLILTNFDDFCEAFKTITLNAAEKGKVISTEEIKYSLDSSTFFNPSFADDVRQNDGEKTAANFLKSFVTSIKKSNGTYVSWNALSNIATTIHQLAEEDPKSASAKFLKEPTFKNLKDALSDQKVRNQSVLQSCDAIVQALVNYNETFQDALSNIKQASRKIELATQRDVLNQLIHYIQSTSALVYVETGEGETIQKTTNRVATSKQAYLNLIVGQAVENYKKRAHNLYQVGYTTSDGETFNQVFSDKALNNLHSILGISLENIQEFFVDENGSKNMLKLASFVSLLQQMYNRYFSHKYLDERELDVVQSTFKNALAKSGEYIDFVNILIDAVDRNNFKILDQNGNNIPGQGIFSLNNNFQVAKEAFKKQFGKSSEKNILIKNDLLTRPNEQSFKRNFDGHSCYRSDVLLKNGIAISPVLLSANETMTLWLSKDFLESSINKGILYLQPEGYSDKPRLAVTAYSIMQLLDSNTKTSELVDTIYEQNKAYYEAIEQKICEKWQKIVNKIQPDNSITIESVEDIVAFLENGVSFEVIHDAVFEVQKDEPEFNFIKDSDFVINKDKLVGLNRAFVLKLATAKNRTLFDYYYNTQLTTFLSDVKNAELPICDIILSDKALKEDGSVDWERINAITGVQFDDQSWKDFFYGSWLNAKKSSTNEIHETILTRYFAIQTLLKEAELQIGIKHPWNHDVGVSDNITTEEVKSLFNGDVKSQAYQKAVKEYTSRLSKGKKRNSAGVVTFTPMYANQYGVSPTMKIAVCQFPQVKVTNHFGTSEYLHPHDGATFVNPIWSILEENSYPGKKYLGSRKTIGLYTTDYSITQIKHAEYTMNNSWIQGTFDEALTQSAFNGEHLMRVMLSPAKTNNLLQSWKAAKDSNKTLQFKPILVNFNGQNAYLDAIDIQDDLSVKFTWKNDNTDEVIDDSLVAGLFSSDVKRSDITGGYVIENLYQLWKAFGGAYCKSYVDQELKTSDANNRMLATLIGQYGDSTIKSQMIAKICDSEAVKSGSLGFNSAQDLVSGKLVTGTFETKYFGIQQDYTHLAEDSEIPALTQVITAIAFNGNNVDLVNKAYVALGEIVEKSLRKYTDYKNIKDLQRMLGERLYKSLKKNSIASNAIQLVQEFLNEINQESALLPVSNPDLFYKIASDIISNLNNETIKQRFKGIALIQNPAQGIVGLYENRNGDIFTRTDLLKKAEAIIDFSSDSELISPSEKINRYLEINKEFWEDESLDTSNFYKIAVGDNVRIGNSIYEVVPFENNFTNGKISLAEIKNIISNNKEVYKVYKKQRNLKCHNITFQEENGSWNNLFCLQSTQAIIEAKNESEKLFAKKWHRENLALLQKGIGYYATKADFISKNKITRILEIKDELGEQVIPKTHSEFNLGSNSLSEILEKGELFFETDIRELLTLKTQLQKGELGLTTNGGEIIFVKRDATVEDKEKQNVYLKKDGLNWIVVDPNDNFLCYAPNNRSVDPEQFCGYLENVDGKRVLKIIANDTSFIKDFVQAIDNGGAKVVQAIYRYTNKGNVLVTDKDTTWKDVAKFNHGVRGNDLETSIKQLTIAKYNSWLLSLKTISARIPSQSFQSFLATKTVAYTDDEFNNGYMNIWEMWFQGSDFDIDKAYTLMFDVSKNGLIQGNVFTDYNSSDFIEKSLKLTTAQDYRLEKTDKQGSSEFDKILQDCGIDVTNRTFSALETRDDKYELIDKIIQRLNEQNVVEYNSEDDVELVQKFINYKQQSSYGFKNKITEIILEQSRNLQNLEASEQPMSTQPIKHAIDNSENKRNLRLGDTASKNKHTYYEWNPWTIARVQYDNSMGKEDVGISANGVKAAGALQQYFNEIYKKPTGDIIKKSFRVDLEFNIEEQNLGKYSFIRLANTVLEQSKFNALFDSNYISEEAHPYYNAFKNLINGKFVPTTEYEKKLQLVYNVYKQEFGVNPPNLKTLLYYAINFEDNVADNLSVFISLATDNAKELQLARIYGTPDLLLMPLAMITLGIDPQTVMDICVEFFGDVADALEVNRFEKNRTNVRDVLKNLNTVDAVTRESLLKIYDFAQELRTITSFFKVNQGVETRYAKLKAWLDNLTLSRSKMASDSIEKIKKQGKYTIDDFKSPFDILKFFNDPTYQDIIIEQYGILKQVVNVGELINESPHFRAQLKATAELINQFESVSGKAWIAKNTISKLDTSIGSKIESETLNSKAFRLVDDWVIGQYLRSSDKFQFVVSSAQDSWDILQNYGRNAVINLSSSEGIRNFVDLVNALIPKLQQQYKDNIFFKSLISKVDKNTGQMYYDFNIDPFATKNDDSLKEAYDSAITQFDFIRKNSSMIRSVDGTQFNIGELLYIYGIITGKGKITGMKTITNNSKNSTILKQGVETVYNDLDRLLLKIQSDAKTEEDLKSKEQARNTLENITTFLAPYLDALYNNSNVTVQDDDETGVSYELDISNNWVSTLSKIGTNFSKNLRLDQLQKYLNSRHVLCDIKVTQDSKSKHIVNIDVLHTGLNGVINDFKLSLSTIEEGVLSEDEIKIACDKVQSFLDSCAPYLDENIQEALSTPTSITKILKDQNISFNTKNKLLKTFLDKDFAILLKLKNGVNYVTEVNGQLLFVIDPVSLSIAEGENPEMALLDLFLQEKAMSLKYGISENARIDALQQLTETELQQFDKNIIRQYIDYLEENSELNEIKTKALTTVFNYENVILSGHKQLYYVDVDKNSNLEQGDLVSDDKHEYIYMADTKHGKNLFVAIDGTQLLTTKVIPNSVKKLIAAPNTFIKDVSSVEVDDTAISIPIGNLYAGCQILKTNGDVYCTISDVLVKSINGRVYHRIIARNSNLDVIVFDKQSDGNWKVTNTTNNNSYTIDKYKTTSVKVPKVKIENVSATNNVNKKDDAVLFNYLLDNLKEGQIVSIINDQQQVTFTGRVLNVDDNIVLTNNGVVNKNKISSIQYGTDSEFFNQVKPVLLGFKKSDFNEKELKSIWHPELSNGYSIIREKQLNNQTTKYNVVILNGHTLDETPKVDCLGLKNQTKLTKTTIKAIKAGDYIETHSRKINTTVYKILEKTQNGFIAEYVTHNYANTNDIGFDKNCGITVVSEQMLLNNNAVKLSEKPQTEFITRQSLKEQLKTIERSELDVCHDVIQAIQNATHLPVVLDYENEIKNKGKTVFATATDSGITIYLKSKPKNVSVSNYILSQCAHEFTHMLLYALKAQSPETYLQIVEWASKQTTKNGIKTDNDVRNAEEYVVELIEKQYASEDDKSFETIRDVINKQFRKIFELSISELDGIDMQYSLINVLQNYGSDFIAETVSEYNMDSFKRQIISNKALSKIKLVC